MGNDSTPLVLTMRDSSDRGRLPPLIMACFIIDVGLALAFMTNELVGEFSSKFTDMFHLEHESNLPTWYSSLQLFAVAALLALFVRCRFDRRRPHAWMLIALPVVFVLLSIDEATEFHEWVGQWLDRLLLPTGDRKDTAFAFTGVWVFVIGPPFLGMLIYMIYGVRGYFTAAPAVASKMVVGAVLFAAGAIGVETLANFVPIGSTAHVVEVFVEELLEMVGVTVILWGVVDLLHAHGFLIQLRRSAN